MELILDKRKTKGKKAHRLQQRFNELRLRLDKERRHSDRFRQDVDDLVEIYQRRSMENDRSMHEQLVHLCERLITFAGRKSLADWHRSELALWLDELINHRIAMIDPAAANRLLREYSATMTRLMGISFDEIAAQIATEAEQAADLFEGKDDGRQQNATEETQRQADIFGFNDEDTDEAEDTDYTDFDAEFAEAFEAFDKGSVDHFDEKLDDRQTLVDGRWAKDMFRRAAQALHPDREQDPERRKTKLMRMQDLLRARKEDDILAILTIYSEHVTGADVELAEHEMIEICDELEGKLDEIKFEKDTYIYTDPLRQMVFEAFYHGTRKGRNRRIKAWEKSLREEASQLKKLIPFLRNLTSLKEVLDERRDDRESMLFSMMMDDEELRIQSSR